MSLDIGFSAQAPSLPNVAGSVGGLGETFSPDLATGTATLSVPLDLPNGPNDIGPKLALRYDGSGPNGPFGLGFALPLPRLVRSTAQSYPAYDDTDVLVLEGAGPVLSLGGGAYRPQVDDGSWRLAASGQGFVATDRGGLRYILGQSPAGRLVDDPAAASPRIFAWHLERIEDALGNAATLTWQRDGLQLYLSSLAYGPYSVQFSYTARPDPLRDGRPGFLTMTALRCTTIELRLPTEAQPILRRWSLAYAQDLGNGASLLSSVAMAGLDAAGTPLATPPLTLGYSTAGTPSLTRFSAADGAAPGLIGRTDRRVELLDWNGDGLPDMVEISPGGNARVWPNLGGCRWGAPETIGSLPLVGTPTAAVAFLDMNGDGQADLVRADGPLGGYMPRIPGAGFAPPIAWRQAPSASPIAATTRMVDLDGDGIPDLLVSNPDGIRLAAFFRASDAGGGWQDVPHEADVSAAVQNLADPHVFVADMTGDGGADLVRVDGGGVTYWPFLGNATWDAPVTMANPPVLPFDVRPQRLFLIDLDGDGCADLVYLDGSRLIYWLNRSGNGFAAPVSVEPVPTGQFGEFRFADMTGAGTTGLFWSAPGPFGRGTQQFFLDPVGGVRPSLLTHIDNGIGRRTAIGYSTSAHEAAADSADGRAWPGILPLVVPVVASIDTTDAATGAISSVRLRYHEGRYDGVLREFAGFGMVERRDLGDASIPTLRTVSVYATGLDPITGAEADTAAARLHWRAIRGRLLRQERYGEDGAPEAAQPYDRQESQWTVAETATPGGTVYQPRLTANIRTTFERAVTAAAILTTTHDAWDANGNVTATTETAATPSDPTLTRSLRAAIQYASDPAGRFLSLPWRVQQFDGAALIADTITEYDHAAEGQTGAQGLVTRRSSLVLTDALVTGIYGAAPPDFTALGYYRRAGETGWWVDQARYQRSDDASGLSGTVTNARGAVSTFTFDATKICPVKVTDAAGNALTVQPNPRLCRVAGLTTPDGSQRTAQYDALARIIAEIEPGDTSAFPTVSYDYKTGQAPVEAMTRRRAVSGQPATIDTRDLYDGSGSLIERRVSDAIGEIVLFSQVNNARGLAAGLWREYRPTSAIYAAPDPAQPHAAMLYDATGRIVQQLNRDGSRRTFSYAPLLIVEADEEDNRVGGTHANTPTRYLFLPSGHLAAVEQNLAGRTTRTVYNYDTKGNLTAHTDAVGNQTRFDYDLLGRQLRVQKPESTTVNAYDAVGNLAEIHPQGGTSTYLVFDACNRPTALHTGAAAAAPQTKWTYHDASGPAPADAGAHTIGGHCVRIDDAGGSTVFDYDQIGRVAVKRLQPSGGAQTYRIDIAYRADGQPASITYPDGGNGRLVQTYEYDRRGNMRRVPGVISNIDYDLGGRRIQIAYGNGTSQSIAYDPVSERLTAMSLSGPAGVIRAVTLSTDLVGNVTGIASADPALVRNHVYDDLYRLITATGGGSTWNYSYDDASNLTQNTALGPFRYGEGGAPATCLTSAGADQFTYTPLGQMAQTPWGMQTFDALGRLAAIVRGSDAMHFTYDFAGNCVAVQSAGTIAPAVNRLTPDKLFSIENGTLILNIFDGAGLAARRTAAGAGAMVWLHADHLGSLIAVTDATGVTIETHSYDPYGAPIGAGIGTVPLGFTGGVPDPWSALVNLGARYYQPSIGRFVSPDPLLQDPGVPVAWSSYVYCGGNPTSFTDPGGRSFWGWVGGIVGGVVGAVAGFLVGGPLGAVAGALAGAAAGAALGGDSSLAKSIGGVLTDPRFWEGVAAVAALVALTALSIVTFGATAGLLVVGIGIVAGGLIGGISAAQQKGSTGWDIVTGVLVGAAVGGWAAFATVYAGAAAAASLGLQGTIPGSIISGAVNGAISGAASGFTTGFAGGKGTWDWGKFLWTVATGAVVGGVLGGSGIAQLLKSDGGDLGNLGVQKVGTVTITNVFGTNTAPLWIDPTQSLFQATATVLGTALKNSLPTSVPEASADKGWIKFGFGLVEFDAEALI